MARTATRRRPAAVTAGLPAITSDPAQAERDIETFGIALLAGLLPDATIERARAALYRAAADDEARGLRRNLFGFDHGDRNHRVWNVLSRDPVFIPIVEHPVVLRLLRRFIGWPALLGNLSANIAEPGSAGGMLHADQSFLGEPWPVEPQGMNAAWLLDDYTEANGATRVVPFSHRLARNVTPEDGDASVPLVAPRGTVAVFESRLWHRTGENRSDAPRAGLFAWYSRWIYRPQENWFLSLSPNVLEGASDELLTLLAWKSEGFGLVNGHSPR